MSIQTKLIRLTVLIGLLGLVILPGPVLAQDESDIPAEVMANNPPDQVLQAEIDKVLGMTESKIKEGIVDPGIDLANLAVNKALDELIKGIADAVVLAPAAEKIMSAYQRIKDNRLVSKLASLRSVWKDGQERLNKLNYQDFKIRYEWATQHNGENKAILGSAVKDAEQQLTKGLYGSYVTAMESIYERGTKGSGLRLARQYLNKGADDFPFYNITVLRTLQDNSLIKARNTFAASKGKAIFLSPYERLRLQLQSLEEARQQHQDIISYTNQTNATLNYYRQAEAELALRKKLSSRISDPYMAKFKSTK